MAAIDIHTHMLTAEWLDLLVERGGDYTVTEVLGGSRAIHKGDAPFMTLTPGMFDYEARITAMDGAGVDIAIVSLTCPNVFWGGPSTSLHAARLVNEDMADAQDRYPGRIRWLASLPWQHPDLAIKELEAARARGAVGVIVLANIDDRPLTDARFADVWAAIDDVGLPVLIHPSLPPGAPVMGMDQYNLAATVGFTFDTTLALSRMILDGFFDRYPRTQIIGGHAGGYLPFLIGRLDKWHRTFEPAREKVKNPPSSYIGRMYADSIVYTKEALELTVSLFGPENVLYGSDYPHKNGDMGEILSLVDQLPTEQSTLIRSENARRLFRL